jgi:hypothetical protein
VGGKPITPIRIADLHRNSPYWNATEAQALSVSPSADMVSTAVDIRVRPA